MMDIAGGFTSKANCGSLVLFVGGWEGRGDLPAGAWRRYCRAELLGKWARANFSCLAAPLITKGLVRLGRALGGCSGGRQRPLQLDRTDGVAA